MKTMMWVLLLVAVLLSCDNAIKKGSETEKNSATNLPTTSSETAKMVEELERIRINADPYGNYTWNNNLAQLFLSKYELEGAEKKKYNWYNYCSQLLMAGETKKCLEGLQYFFGQSDFPHEELLNEQTQGIFELMAIAYLRLGEQENCQNNHNTQSCIVPFRKEGIHELKSGSEKAVKLFSMLHHRFPKPSYKWLINLCHMTLGTYPQSVPEQQLLAVPALSENSSFPFFKDVAMELGLGDFGYAGGVCMDDFNNDGYLDLFITSSGMADNVKLYLSDQNGGYNNATASAGLQGIVGGFNCIQADYNNDGFIDMLILRGAWLKEAGHQPNSLLKNNGDGTFTDVSWSSKIISYHPTQTAAWGDFNQDGHLDLFIGNESKKNDPHRSELFKNNGDGTFTEVGASYGLGFYAYIKGVAWGDINNDGLPDLYISRLGGKNKLFRNDQTSFTDISESAGVDQPFRSFPLWFWDVNNDGWEDLLVLPYDISEPGTAGNYALELERKKFFSETPKLYINNGDETFTESSKEFGLEKPMAAMGTNWGDIDNDGFLDFYVGTGTPLLQDIVPNRMFRNVDGKYFEEVSSAGNFGHIQKGHGVAFGDLDQDGDQDIYAVMGGFYEGDGFYNILYENPISDNQWIIIKLIGKTINSSAIGTKVVLTLDNGRKIYRTLGSGGSFGSSPLLLQIGLGKAQKIEKLVVHWTHEKKQTFRHIQSNQKIAIRENEPIYAVQEYKHNPFQKAAQPEHHHP